jgi:hypothetical protein
MIRYSSIKKVIYFFTITLPSGFALAQQSQVVTKTNPCTDKSSIFVFTNNPRKPYTVSGYVEKDLGANKKYVLSVTIINCKTGREKELINQCDYPKFDYACLPSAIIIEKGDSTLTLTYLADLFKENWEKAEIPFFKRTIIFGKDSAYVGKEEGVYEKIAITPAQNKEVVNDLKRIKKLWEGRTLNTMKESGHIFADYMRKLLTCSLAGYKDTHDIFLHLRRRIVFETEMADVYWRQLFIYHLARLSSTKK